MAGSWAALALLLGCLAPPAGALRSHSPGFRFRGGQPDSNPNGDSHGWMSIGQTHASRAGGAGRGDAARLMADYTPGPLLTSPHSVANSPLVSTLRGEEEASRAAARDRPTYKLRDPPPPYGAVRGGGADETVEPRGGVALAEASLRRALDDGQKPHVSLFNEVLHSLFTAAKQDKASIVDARAVFAQMEAAQVEPDVDTYTLLLDVAACDVRKGRGGEAEAEEVFRKALASDLPPDSRTFRAMMGVVLAAAAAGASTAKDGEHVLDKMRSTGLQPDVSLYNTQCEIVAKAARHGRSRVSEGLAVLATMRREGLTPDVNTFRTLMDITAWCARRGKAGLRDAEQILSDMKETGRRPTAATYNGLMAVVAGLAGRGAATVLDGYDVLKRMAAAGVAPTAVTYSAMMAVVAGCSRHGKASLKDGELVLDRMLDARLRPDVITYNALLAVTVGVAQQGKASLQDGARVVAKMTASGTRPDAVTLNTLLEVVAEAARHGRGTARDAERVMDMMRVAGVPLDMSTFRALEKVWKADEGGEADAAKRVLSPAERSSAAVRYSSLLSLVARSAWEGGATLEDALLIEQRMLAEGLGSNAECLGMLMESAIGACTHGGARLSDGEAILERARERGVVIGERTYVQLMGMVGALAKAGKAGPRDAEKVLLAMPGAGLTPGAVMFDAMLDVVRDSTARDKSNSQYLRGTLARMAECGVRPDSRAVIKAAEVARLGGSVDAAREASGLLMQLPARGRSPEAVAAVLVSECATTGNRTAIVSLLSMLRGTPARSPGAQVYKTAIRAAASPKIVMLLRDTMLEDGEEEDWETRKLMEKAKEELDRWGPLEKVFSSLSAVGAGVRHPDVHRPKVSAGGYMLAVGCVAAWAVWAKHPAVGWVGGGLRAVAGGAGKPLVGCTNLLGGGLRVALSPLMWPAGMLSWVGDQGRVMEEARERRRERRRRREEAQEKKQVPKWFDDIKWSEDD